MVTFLYVLVSLSLLVAFGVGVSFYLYNRGAIGRRPLQRSRGYRMLVFETASEDDKSDHFSIGVAPAYDTTSRYARTGLLILLASFLVVMMFVTTLVGTIVH